MIVFVTPLHSAVLIGQKAGRRAVRALLRRKKKITTLGIQKELSACEKCRVAHPRLRFPAFSFLLDSSVFCCFLKHIGIFISLVPSFYARSLQHCILPVATICRHWPMIHSACLWQRGKNECLMRNLREAAVMAPKSLLPFG